MRPIVTITVNPAVDLSTSVESLMPEKKMHCDLPIQQPGGGGINIARAIKKLNGEATAVFFAGGCNGQLMTSMLSIEGVRNVSVPTRNATRENITVLDRAANLQYRFTMPGEPVCEEEVQELLKIVEQLCEDAYLIVSGSLSPGIQPVLFSKLAKIAASKNARLVVDTSGEALRLAAQEHVYLIKPNLAELALLAGEKSLTATEAIPAAQRILKQYPIDIIVVSLGSAGAALVTQNESYQFNAPPVKTVSTVGAGDSMMAGLVLALNEEKPLKDVLRFGIACGSAATLRPGTSLCERCDVDRLFSLQVN